MKEIQTQIQKTQRIPSKINSQTVTHTYVYARVHALMYIRVHIYIHASKHILFKMLKAKD